MQSRRRPEPGRQQVLKGLRLGFLDFGRGGGSRPDLDGKNGMKDGNGIRKFPNGFLEKSRKGLFFAQECNKKEFNFPKERPISEKFGKNRPNFGNFRNKDGGGVSKKPEISVKQAAGQIDCSERTIINFIKMKRFEALKVGRDWFIDYASFISFAKRYKYQIRDEVLEPREQIPPPSSATGPEQGKNRRYGNVETLRVYQIFRDIFEKGNFQNLPEGLRESKIVSLGEGVFEEIGAGFYAFGTHVKRLHYANARSRLGSIIALLYSNAEMRERWREEIHQIEERLLPAFGALIKKLEQKSHRNGNEGAA